eukprot:scaffold81103_cov28-Tisochrysis_lutea.AAC.7
MSPPPQRRHICHFYLLGLSGRVGWRRAAVIPQRSRHHMCAACSLWTSACALTFYSCLLGLCMRSNAAIYPLASPLPSAHPCLDMKVGALSGGDEDFQSHVGLRRFHAMCSN